MALTLNGMPTTTTTRCNYSAGSFTKPGGAQSKNYKQTYISDASDITVTRQTRRMEADEITIGDLEYSWSFGSTRASGIYTFTGLSTGALNTISATVTVTCKKTTTHWLRTDVRTRTAGKPGTPASGDTPAVPATPPGAWTDWVEGTESHGLARTETLPVGERTYRLDVYTKPGYWTGFANIKVDAIIEDTLLGSEWDSLGRQASKYRNWENQRDMGISVSRGTGWVTAALYNEMAEACNISRHVKVDDLIYASYFLELRDAVQGGN